MQALRNRKKGNSVNRISFLNKMTFDDDEQIVAIPTQGNEDKKSRVEMMLDNEAEATLEEEQMKVELELTAHGKANDRPGLDIVMVLDVSSSMKGERLHKMKTAAKFLINKLTSTDRLSVVTFSNDATRRCPLLQITENSEWEIEKLVSDLNIAGQTSDTNITTGLHMGLQVLSDRRITEGRSVGIVLMSAGEQNKGRDAAKVRAGVVPVYTFGFVAGGTFPLQNIYASVFNWIATNSRGGTFSSDVLNTDDTGAAFSQCLAGLSTVAVQDLKLIISPERNSRIENVFAGDSDESRDNTTVTIMFGNLYDKETRKITVHLILPKVPNEVSARVLKISYNYSNKEGKEMKSPPLFASVKRIGKFTEEETEEVIEEATRLETVGLMKEARLLASNIKLDDVKDKLLEAQKMLEYVEVDEPNPITKILKFELQQLLTLIESPMSYKNQGHPYTLQSDLSHERQRFAARGETEKVQVFSTPRVDAYQEQVKSFDMDSSTKPYALSSELSPERQYFAARGDTEKLRLFSTPHMDAYQEQAKSFDTDSSTKPYALSSEVSPERQQYAARGDTEKHRLFSTPRMDAYQEQAKSFDTDSSTKPYAMPSELSPQRQQFAARGDTEKLRLFATPRMDTYQEQAKLFDTDPSTKTYAPSSELSHERQCYAARGDPEKLRFHPTARKDA